MPVMRGRGWALAALVAVMGCGGAPPAPEPARVALAGDGCGAQQTRVGGTCWSAEGTRWRVLADASAGVDEFELELLAAGRVRSTDNPHASPATDEWFQEGRFLRVFLAERFVEYRAEVTNGTVLVGDALNVRGQRWPWRGDRAFGEGACSPGEARLADACMTVEGTRWRVEGVDPVVELLGGGVVVAGGGDPGADRWEQEGTQVRFSLDEGARRFEGTLEGDAALRGLERGRGAFVAHREASIPPPLR